MALGLDEAELAVGDRVAVRIVRRVSELLVDLRLELLGQRVLEQLRLGVHLVEGETEPVDEVALEQAVMAKHLERPEAALVGQRDAAIGQPLDEPELVQALGHRRRRRCADTHAPRERGRRDAFPGGLEDVDRLQVVLYGDGEVG